MKKLIILILLAFIHFNVFSQENWKEENLRAITNYQRVKTGLSMVQESDYYNQITKFIKTIEKPDTTEESISKVITQLNNHCDFAFPNEKVIVHYGAIITDPKTQDVDINLFAQIESKVPNSLFKDINLKNVLFKQWEYKSHGKKILFVYIVGFLKDDI